jgi:hypothetical protein
MGLLGICAHPGDQPIEYLNCTHSESQQSVIILLVQPAYKGAFGALLTLETTALLHDNNTGQLLLLLLYCHGNSLRHKPADPKSNR